MHSCVAHSSSSRSQTEAIKLGSGQSTTAGIPAVNYAMNINISLSVQLVILDAPQHPSPRAFLTVQMRSESKRCINAIILSGNHVIWSYVTVAAWLYRWSISSKRKWRIKFAFYLHQTEPQATLLSETPARGHFEPQALLLSVHT